MLVIVACTAFYFMVSDMSNPWAFYVFSNRTIMLYAVISGFFAMDAFFAF